VRAALRPTRAAGLALILLLAACVGDEPAPAPPEDPSVIYQRYMDAGQRWERTGSPDAATLYYERAVEVARTLPQPDVRLARARFELGDSLRRQARLEEAETALRQALDDLGALPEPEPDLRARILDGIGYCQLAMGNADAATRTLAGALQIRVEQLDAWDAATAETMVNLAEAHHRVGDDETALTLLVEAGFVYQGLGPDYLIRMATVHDNMGRICRELGRHADSERLHKRAISLASRVQEENNPNIAIFQRNLANLYVVTGNEEEAEALYRKSLATLERTVGPDHYETRATRSMLERNFPEDPEAEAEPGTS
jgi:tetratricopeptide (TPR) repeat protein